MGASEIAVELNDFDDYYTVRDRTRSREITLRAEDLKGRHLYEHTLIPIMLTDSDKAKLEAQGFMF